MNQENKKGFMAHALSSQILLSSLKVSIVVGTLLALINYGDKLISMSLIYSDFFKILLTYFVPYCVSTWSAVKAIQAHES